MSEENLPKESEISKWFRLGRESVLRKNQSGCCCMISEDGDEVIEPCYLHKLWAESIINKERI